MAAKVIRRSYALEVLLAMEHEFSELEQVHGTGNLHEQSMEEDTGSSSIMSEMKSDQDEQCLNTK